MPVPSVVVRIAFDTDPLAITPTWTDVSADVKSISSIRGRNHELNREEAGTLEVKLLNTSGNYWPDNAGGSYYGKIKPKKRINLRVTWNSITYDVFTGYIESWRPQFLSKPDRLPVMVLTCSDGLKYLAGYQLPSDRTGTFANGTGTATNSPILLDENEITVNVLTAGNFTATIPTGFSGLAISGTSAVVTGSPQALSAGANTVTVTGTGSITIKVCRYAQEKSGTRIGHVLDDLGWPAADRDIDTGQSDMIASGNFDDLGVSHLRAVQEAEQGILFVAADGKMTFKDRHARLTDGASTDGEYIFATLPAVTVPTAGSRVQVSTRSLPSCEVILAAPSTNTGYIYVGDVNVSSTRYSSRLLPGEEVHLSVADVNKVYIDASVNGEGVEVSYYNNSPTIFAIDDDDQMLVKDSDLVLEDQYIKNDVRITRDGGAEQVDTDATSQSAYGKVTLSKTGLLLTTDSEAADQAAYLLSRYKDPFMRIKALTILPGADAYLLYPKVLSYDIGMRITVQLDQASISRDYIIEAVSHEWNALNPQMFTTKWQLTDASSETYWKLGDSTWGVLGDTTVLGY